MKWTFLIFFLVFLHPEVSFSNRLYSDDSYVLFSAVPFNKEKGPHKNHDSLIKMCSLNKSTNAEDCSTFPKISIYSFKGTDENWNYFFERCKNFDHINNLTTVTQAIATLVVMPKLGFLKTMGAEVAVGFLGKDPYPSDVNKAALEKSRDMVTYIRKNKGKQLKIEIKYLLALQDILSVCSSSFGPDFINHEASKCVANCHQSKSKVKDDGEAKHGQPNGQGWRFPRFQKPSEDLESDIHKYLNRPSHGVQQ